MNMIPRPLSTFERSPPKLIKRKPLKHDTSIRLGAQRVHKGWAVTVCIAAFADKRRAIVMVADRSLSIVRDKQTILKADSVVTKLRELEDKWIGCFSGSIDFGITALSWANNSYKHDKTKSLPEQAKLAFQSCRKIHILDNILIPRGLSYSWYHERLMKEITNSDSIFWDVYSDIANFNTETSLMVCGFEDSAPGIYIINDPGTQERSSEQGFGVVGMGSEIARQRLITLRTIPDNSTHSVLYDLYDAKESCAELLPDVGHKWDAIVLKPGLLPTVLEIDTKEIVEELYKVHPKSPFKPFPCHTEDHKAKLMSYIERDEKNAQNISESAEALKHGE